MAFNERERRGYVVRSISRGNLGGTSDEAIGVRAADIFLNKVRRRPGGSKLLENLSNQAYRRSTNSEAENFGVTESSLERRRRINMLPDDAYEFVATMSSYFLSRIRSIKYLRSREQRVEVAGLLSELGVGGEELGFIMDFLHDLALDNAQPRRRINRRVL